MTEAGFVAETVFRVRYAETDAMRIVHHASYIVYFEEGRSEYIRQRGSSYAEFERSGYFLAVSEIQARYISPARYDQALRIRCQVAEARSRTITFSYEVLDHENGDLLVTGVSKHICIDGNGKVTKIPEQWRQWLD